MAEANARAWTDGEETTAVGDPNQTHIAYHAVLQ
jgi:hypothetical protein